MEEILEKLLHKIKRNKVNYKVDGGKVSFSDLEHLIKGTIEDIKKENIEGEFEKLKFALATVGVRQNKILERVNKNSEFIDYLFKKFTDVLGEFVKWGDKTQERLKDLRKIKGE